MKTFFTLLFVSVFFNCSIDAQTLAEPPGPENVLVVYRLDHSYSFEIKDHYVEKRNIPLTNIVPIDLSQSYPGITFDHQNEVIQGEGDIA